PVVGEESAGGPEASPTGGIRRKLHRQTRRIRIDARDGGKIDVTAEIPSHLAESLATLGFEAAAGDIAPVRAAASPGKRIAAAAKARRRERRGERRARGSQPKAKRR